VCVPTGNWHSPEIESQLFTNSAKTLVYTIITDADETLNRNETSLDLLYRLLRWKKQSQLPTSCEAIPKTANAAGANYSLQLYKEIAQQTGYGTYRQPLASSLITQPATPHCPLLAAPPQAACSDQGAWLVVGLPSPPPSDASRPWLVVVWLLEVRAGAGGPRRAVVRVTISERC